MDIRAVVFVAALSACAAGASRVEEGVASGNAGASGAIDPPTSGRGGAPEVQADHQGGAHDSPVATGGKVVAPAVETGGVDAAGGHSESGGAPPASRGGVSGDSSDDVSGAAGAGCSGPTQLDCGPDVGCVSSSWVRCGSCLSSCLEYWSEFSPVECVYWFGESSEELFVEHGEIGCAGRGFCGEHPADCRVLG
jgi:hypothetical protein